MRISTSELKNIKVGDRIVCRPITSDGCRKVRRTVTEIRHQEREVIIGQDGSCRLDCDEELIYIDFEQEDGSIERIPFARKTVICVRHNGWSPFFLRSHEIIEVSK